MATTISSAASSEGNSSSSGVVNMSTRSTSASTAFICSSFSCSSSRALQILSLWTASFRLFMCSCKAALSLPASFSSSAAHAGDSLARGSFCLATTSDRASPPMTAADFSTSIAFSVSSLSLAMLSSSAWLPSSGTVASVSAFTFASRLSTFSVRFLSRAPTSRCSVSRRKAVSFCDTASTRSCSCESSAVMLSCESWGKRLTSASADTRNDFAWSTLPCAASAADFEAPIAFLAASPDSEPGSATNGASASAVLMKASSAASALSRAFFSSSPTWSWSSCDRSRVLRSSSFSVASAPWTWIWESSSFRAPWACSTLSPTKVIALERLEATAASAASAAFASSADASTPPWTAMTPETFASTSVSPRDATATASLALSFSAKLARRFL
mmetsp:Transcript_12583/g.35142  ORF Transcript_12583/g.35142 Transcript_12583/m.35142 type:complete len:388 (+) Transcript_12583:610-1773(+)